MDTITLIEELRDNATGEWWTTGARFDVVSIHHFAITFCRQYPAWMIGELTDRGVTLHGHIKGWLQDALAHGATGLQDSPRLRFTLA